jgi:hypothetical protein
MRAPGGREAIALPALLDSGAAESLFDGGYLEAIGMDLLASQPRRFQTTGGQLIDARHHPVELIHEKLGRSTWTSRSNVQSSGAGSGLKQLLESSLMVLGGAFS